MVSIAPKRNINIPELLRRLLRRIFKVQAGYQPIPRSDFQFQIQGLPYVFNTVTQIDVRATEGSEFFHPGARRITTLSGPKRNEDITATAILSPTQFTQLENLFESTKSSDGSLTATHQAGTIRKSLLGVRIKRVSYGDGDRTSSDPFYVSIVCSFETARRA